MSIYKKAVLRLAGLAVLVAGLVVLSNPQKVHAFTCLDDCFQAKEACLATCHDGPPFPPPNCIPDCNDDYQACIAGC